MSMAADDARMAHFRALPHAEQHAAIARLIARGFGDHSIAQATCLSVEQVRAIRAGVSQLPERSHDTAAVAHPRFDS